MKDADIDILEYYYIIKKRIKIVIEVFSLFLILALIYAFLAPKTYVADASIYPSLEEEKTTNLSALGGLATNLGIANLQSKNMSDLYPEILKSRPLIYSLLQKEIENPETSKHEMVMDLLDVSGNTIEKKLDKGYKGFLKCLDTYVDDKTGIVSVSVETNINWLSKVIVDELLHLLIKYNKETRTFKARENRLFIEEQLERFDKAFTLAEKKLTEFRRNNIQIGKDADLMKERARLQLEYDVSRTNYINFKNEYEMAKLQEVKDTPVLNILNTPVIPQHKNRPHRLLILVISGSIGLLFGIFGTFVIEFTERRKNESSNAEAVS